MREKNVRRFAGRHSSGRGDITSLTRALLMIVCATALPCAPTAAQTITQTITQIIDSTGDGAGNTLSSPFAVAVDGSGNVYVPGLGGTNNVFKITPGGVITQIIDATGDGAGNTLNAPFRIAVDGSGNVYVAGRDSDNAFKIATPGTCSTNGTPCVITEIIDATGDGAGNTLINARGVAVDGSGNVYVAGAGTSNAFKITPGGVITEIIDATGDGAGNTLSIPQGVAVDGSGNVYVVGETTDNAFKIATPGTCSTSGTPCVITEIIDATGDGAANTLSIPQDVAVDTAGNVYVLGQGTQNAFKIATPGTCSVSGTPCVITEIIDATGDGAGHTLDNPQGGIAVDTSGNVYVTGFASDNAFKITPAGTITQIIDATGDGAGNTLISAAGVAVDGSANVYVVGISSTNAFKILQPVFVDADAVGLADGTSWTDAYTTLQDGLADARITGGNAEQIWVAEGTYYPDEGGAAVAGVRTETFQLVNGVAILGGFAGDETMQSQRDPENRATILSGDLSADDDPADFPGGTSFTDNSLHVVTGSGTDATAILDGFTITAGNADGLAPDDRGGGMVNNAGSPTVNNCRFIRNSANDEGGGMHNRVGSDATVTHCAFSGNSAGGDGGGMFNANSTPTVANCSFNGNTAARAGGMFNNAAGSLIVINCTFSGNSSLGTNGGAIFSTGGSTPEIINCAFTGNAASTNGGAISSSLSCPTLTNCTLSGNTAGNFGGGLHNNNCSATLTNCILWGNSDSVGMGEFSQMATNVGTPVVNHSIVQGGWSGAGGLGVLPFDPLFVDADGADNIPGTEDDDLHLQVGSFAIDAADNAAVPADTADLDDDGDTAEATPLDLENRFRFADDPDATDCAFAPGTCGIAPIADMGALEFFKPIYVNDTAGGADDGSSWADAYNNFRDALQAADALNGDGDSGNDVSQIWVAAGTYKPTVQTCGNVGDCGGQFGGASACSAGLCVWINPRFQTFRMLDGVSLFGGFTGIETTTADRNFTANPTILSGDVDGDDADVVCTQDAPDCDGVLGGLCLDGFCIIKDNNAENSLHVVTATGIYATGVLDGFTITGGNAGGPEAGGTPIGGGVLAGFSGDGVVTRATIRNCVLTGNSAGDDGGNGGSGGGMYSNKSNPLSSPTVRDCVFRGNASLGILSSGLGGGLTYLKSSGEITGCRFVANTAFAGGGGLFLGGLGGNITLANSVIVGNRSLDAASRGGGLSIVQGDLEITNCVFSGNIAPLGGALNISVSSQTFTNCTFSNNSAVIDGGAVFTDSSTSAVFTNCILWNNPVSGVTALGLELFDQGMPSTVDYSVILGGWVGPGGTGIIDADPQFRNANGSDLVFGTLDDDLRLTPGSPAIDSGSNDAAAPDTTDLDGDLNTVEAIPLDVNDLARFLDEPATADTGQGTAPIVDMGAIEFFLDCNDNGIVDSDDITNLTSEDCNGNNIPDECELAECDGSAACSDCNMNMILDECDIADCVADPTCADCNVNGVPDGCDLDDCNGSPQCSDCNGNALIDECDILTLASPDCNINDTPDECEIDVLSPAPGGPFFCAAGCDPDCDDDGVPDACNIAACDPLIDPGCDDCNVNGVPDACDIAGPTSTDIDVNGIPDECANWDGSADNNWSTDLNWDGGVSPNNAGITTFSAAIEVTSATVDLDVSVTIDTLQLDDSTLNVTGAAGEDIQVLEPGGLVNNGKILVANDRMIDVSAGSVELGERGVYEAADPMDLTVSAALMANDLMIRKGASGQVAGPTATRGTLNLQGTMVVDTTLDLVMDGVGASGSSPSVIAGGITPPPQLAMRGGARITSGRNIVLTGSVDFEMNAAALAIAGMAAPTIEAKRDFGNFSTSPSGFNWVAGKLLLNGSQLQAFEVAGEDLGATLDGFLHPIDGHLNFSITELELAAGSLVVFENTFGNVLDNGPCAEALYVETLTLGAGAIVTLDHSKVYYKTLIDNGAAITVCGCGGLVQVCASPPCVGAPSNDACANAAVLCGNLNPFDSTTATDDGPADCTGEPLAGTKDLWFEHTAECTGTLSVSLCDGTAYDTTVQVYDGLGCGGSLGSQLGCDNDGCGILAGPSLAKVAVTEGQDYLIRIGGLDGDGGDGVINVFCTLPAPPARPSAENYFGTCRNGTCAVNSNVLCASNLDCVALAPPIAGTQSGIICGTSGGTQADADLDCRFGNANAQAFCIADEDADFPGICYVAKNRYVSINANALNGGQLTARRVSFIPPGGGASQIIGWVGAPTELIAGQQPPVGFPNSEPNVFVSQLSQIPHFMDWTTVDTVHLTGCGIRPGDTVEGFTYLIQSIFDAADITAETSYSQALALRTVAKYGDSSGGLLTSGQLSPPQNSNNIQDVFAAVALFTATNESISMIWADLTPEIPNKFINLQDVFGAVGGFTSGGAAYPFTADPCACLGCTPNG